MFQEAKKYLVVKNESSCSHDCEFISSKSVGKQMWAIFFRSSGFVAAVELEDRKTVTADW